MTARSEPAALLTPLIQAATAVAGLHVSLPATGRVGSGTRRVIGPALDAWSAILAEAGAVGLPLPRAVEEPEYVTMGTDPLGQYTGEELAELGTGQGVALAAWVEAAGEEWRSRGRRVASAFRRLVRAVERRVGQLATAAGDAADSVTTELRTFLRRWADGAMGIHRDMMGALGRAAWGAGFGLVLIGAAYLWSRKRG